MNDRFSPYGAIESVKKLKDYAFVHFVEREHALQVRLILAPRIVALITAGCLTLRFRFLAGHE